MAQSSVFLTPLEDNNKFDEINASYQLIMTPKRKTPKPRKSLQVIFKNSSPENAKDKSGYQHSEKCKDLYRRFCSGNFNGMKFIKQNNQKESFKSSSISPLTTDRLDESDPDDLLLKDVEQEIYFIKRSNKKKGFTDNSISRKSVTPSQIKTPLGLGIVQNKECETPLKKQKSSTPYPFGVRRTIRKKLY